SVPPAPRLAPLPALPVDDAHQHPPAAAALRQQRIAHHPYRHPAGAQHVDLALVDPAEVPQGPAEFDKFLAIHVEVTEIDRFSGFLPAKEPLCGSARMQDFPGTRVVHPHRERMVLDEEPELLLALAEVLLH